MSRPMVPGSGGFLPSHLSATCQCDRLSREQLVRRGKPASRIINLQDANMKYFQKTLDYSCVCSNGQSPNSSEYSQTIPYFICTEANNQCVTNCEGDASCQSACRDDHPCGAQNPKRYNITTTTSATSNPTASASGTDSGSVVYTGFGTGTASTASAKKGSASTFVLEIGQVYGLFGLVAGFLGGFALLL